MPTGNAAPLYIEFSCTYDGAAHKAWLQLRLAIATGLPVYAIRGSGPGWCD